MHYAQTPLPPYYAVIFTSLRTDIDEGYTHMADLLKELAKDQPGYLGIESARAEIGITVSYWESLEAIKNWKKQSDHVIAQQKGRDLWYKSYKTRICLVERDYNFKETE